MPCTHFAVHVPCSGAAVEFLHRYCGTEIVCSRPSGRTDQRVYWCSEPGKETDFIYVVLPDRKEDIPQQQWRRDLSHMGMSCDSREEVEAYAAKAEEDGILSLPPMDLPFPTGYVCLVHAPWGGLVEFSYGQPLGTMDCCR
ncbi:hypothetical protein KIPB_000131 [Kipferlia bialata]|uniref:VOC domain-containing protein n=1 Tax=Kipferlia bialata TaxID=797122 RepID=A0A9K3GE45_9EUKA|nr:hypothetical protein KIPB_000131 [Kipferlia bialata]|eukprot:g131.t1